MNYVTTPGRVGLSLGGGALTGAVLLSLYMTLSTLPYVTLAPPVDAAGLWWILLLEILILAVVWLLGLVLIGLPAWLVLHYLGLRHWLWAVSAGAVLTSATAYVIAIESGVFYGVAGFTEYDGIDPITLTESELASRKQQTALFASFVLGVIGAAVGFAIWRIAYRPASGSQA